MSLKNKIAQLIEHIRNGTSMTNRSLTNLLQDPIVKNFISKQDQIGCYFFGCGQPCYDRHSPLHFAVCEGRSKVVAELLNCGANINSIEESRGGDTSLTPLHCAIQSNKYDMIQMLMDFGANPNIKGTGWDFEDKSPLELMTQKNKKNARITRVLKRKSDESPANDCKLPLKLAKLETSSKLITNLIAKRDQIEHLSDVEIICKSGSDETVFKCHKSILAVSSPVFFDLFKDEHSEPSKSGKIIVKNIPVHVMKLFLDFLYEDGLENVDLDDVEELIKVGGKYIVEGLKKSCEQELIKILTISNCVFLLHLAKKVGGDQLQAEAFDMVIGNLEEVRASKDFMLLMQDFPDALYEKRE